MYSRESPCWVFVLRVLICFLLLEDFTYLFLESREEREKERERNINVWLPLTRPLLGTWLATQACALTGNQTGDPLVHRPALNPLSHTGQGSSVVFYLLFFLLLLKASSLIFVAVLVWC